MEQDGLCFEAVTTATADLLVVALNVFGHVVVNDEAHVRFVNPHPEGYGGTDNFYTVVHKVFLNAGTVFKA
ncbi:MAG: Uncharacterised protein [Cryomorphaceae bacterium]|nr:MAG: Uncharacterised protein [Cryomorphaceae bacterium]